MIPQKILGQYLKRTAVNRWLNIEFYAIVRSLMRSAFLANIKEILDADFEKEKGIRTKTIIWNFFLTLGG